MTKAPENIDDEALIDRIMAAYKKAIKTEFGSNYWVTLFGDWKRPIHDAIIDGNKDTFAQQLRKPRTNKLFYGFEILTDELPSNSAYFDHYATTVYDALLRFCEAIGACKLENAESYEFDKEPPEPAPVEDLVAALERVIGGPLDFSNPYPNEPGLRTPRGIAGYRAVQSAYQGYRIAKLAQEIGGPVLEIGGGLGRTAYYSTLFGVKNYTIVDIPMTSIAQAYFLGRTCGVNAIRLYGETAQASIELIPPDEFFSGDQQYGLIVNIDGLPEIEDEMASKYISQIAKRSERFLSINHEVMSLRTVAEIVRSNGGVSLGRHPYWLRRGYVDELFSFRTPRRASFLSALFRRKALLGVF